MTNDNNWYLIFENIFTNQEANFLQIILLLPSHILADQ